jgi:hypothetical protein
MDGSPAELRGKAERYRRLASTVTDAQALKALCELAAHYEALAAELEKKIRPQVKIPCRRAISVNPLAGPGQALRPGRLRMAHYRIARTFGLPMHASPSERGHDTGGGGASFICRVGVI